MCVCVYVCACVRAGVFMCVNVCMFVYRENCKEIFKVRFKLELILIIINFTHRHIHAHTHTLKIKSSIIKNDDTIKISYNHVIKLYIF